MRIASVLLAFAVLLATTNPARAYRNHFQYISPRPNAELVKPGATIIVRPISGIAPSIRVDGSTSGEHSGRWITVDDGRTFIFKPDIAFAPGERVSVFLFATTSTRRTQKEINHASNETADVLLTFDIALQNPTLLARPEHLEDSADDPAPADTPFFPRQAAALNYNGLPLPMDFHAVTVTHSDNPTPGYVFVATRGPSRNPAAPYLMMFDNAGAPVFFRRLPANSFDFKRHANGRISYVDAVENKFVVLDDSFTEVATYTAGNGYETDFHDLQISTDGHGLLMIYDPQTVNMARRVPGGKSDATVIGLVIQEIDLSGNVLYQWRSWDHMNIFDASGIDFTDDQIDYAHGNSLEYDTDGHILVSSRHLDEVTKIDRQTGDIIWRMGGKRNEFELIDDDQWFTRQHDARRLPNGNITIFDNGNNNNPAETRVIEYEVDELYKVAKRVWEYRNDPAVFAPFTGNAQRLSNGNTFISWGNTGLFTEVRRDGSKAFELHFAEGNVRTYRGFRFDWNGVAARPELWHRTDDDVLTLYFAKFGDDNVDKYEVYRGDSPSTMARVASTTNSSIVIHNFEAGNPLYFQVTATDDDSGAGPPSNMIAVTPDFSENTGSVASLVSIEPRTINLKSHGQWIHARVTLPEDCGCVAGDIDRAFTMNGVVDGEAIWLDDAGTPATGTSAAGADAVGNAGDQVMVRFPREEVAAILPVGGEVEVTVVGRLSDIPIVGTGTIRVIRPGRGPSLASDRDARLPDNIALHPNSPNPFNPTTTISFDLPTRSTVRLSIYAVDGSLVRTLADNSMPAGNHSIDWDGKNTLGRPASSGVYFFRLETGSQPITRKMILLK